jgi:hypothetical protein
MTPEQLTWGAQEHQQRLADIVEVKAGRMPLEEAQKRARKRARQSGMSSAQAHRAMWEGSRSQRNREDSHGA